MMINEKNLVRHELIGLNARITKAKNPSLVDVIGIIIDETQNTLVLRTNEKTKTAAKRDCTFEIEIPGNKRVVVDGRLLFGRPTERIKKKAPKKWESVK